MKITLAQALPLRKQMERALSALVTEREKSAYEEVAKGQSPEAQGRSLELITTEINKTHTDLLALQKAIDAANFSSFIEWDSQNYTLLQAIEHAKFLRQEANIYSSFSKSKKIERARNGYMEKSELLKVAMFDPEEYRMLSKKLERHANLLSSMIEDANHKNTIDFDAEGYIGL